MNGPSAKVVAEKTYQDFNKQQSTVSNSLNEAPTIMRTANGALNDVAEMVHACAGHLEMAALLR